MRGCLAGNQSFIVLYGTNWMWLVNNKGVNLTPTSWWSRNDFETIILKLQKKNYAVVALIHSRPAIYPDCALG